QFDKLLRTPPEEAARQILNAVLKNQRRLLIGTDARIVDAFQRLFPTGYQRLSMLATKVMN
ncbi:MAG: short-chain dehydrogenase, partial [Acinetobacter sp.]